MGSAGLPATSRTGRADQALAAAHSPLPPAGYEPTELDRVIKHHIAVAERTIRHADQLGKKADAAIERLSLEAPGADALADVETLTALNEKQSKAALNLVKATDELSRLRSFLAGGPDSRPDLSSRGEVELTVILVKAIRAKGWKVVDEAGAEISVEEA